MHTEVLVHLIEGFSIALQLKNLAFAFCGAFLGTVVGVLPGIGPAGALALILPMVFSLNPASAIIMLAAVYSGAMYGGSTTSILINVPGESSSVVTCLDGYQMALQGRAGPALCIAAIGSYIAGTLGVIGLMFFGPMLADFALKFGPPEYFALMVFGLSAVASLAGESLVKGLMSMTIGLLLATIGTDITGVERFTFNIGDLSEGIEFLALTIGLFAISEVLLTSGKLGNGLSRRVIKHTIWISLKDFLYSFGAIIRGSLIGFFVGILPGAGAGIASFISYSVETQISRHPERFGRGEIKGVAAPESANNAASAGAMVTMLTLGIPGSGTTAIMLAALMALDVNTGPLIFTAHPEVVWGLIAALYIGNIMLLVLNLPLIGIFVRLLHVPMQMLLPIIIVISVVGVYNTNRSILDLVFLCGFGLLGYYMRQNNYPVAPVILGFVLGGRMEEALRQSMIMFQRNPFFITERPIGIFFIILALVFILLPQILKRLPGGTAIEREDS